MKKLLLIFTLLFVSQNIICSDNSQNNQVAKIQRIITPKEKILIALCLIQGSIWTVEAAQGYRDKRTLVQGVIRETILLTWHIATNFLLNKAIPNTGQVFPVKDEMLDNANIQCGNTILISLLQHKQRKYFRNAMNCAFSNPKQCGLDLRFALYVQMAMLLTDASIRIYSNYKFSSKTASQRQDQYNSQGLLKPETQYHLNDLINDICNDFSNVLCNGEFNDLYKKFLSLKETNKQIEQNLQLLIDPTGTTTNNDTTPYLNDLDAVKKLYHTQSLKHHPDKTGTTDDTLFKTVDAAYKQLQELFNHRTKMQYT